MTFDSKWASLAFLVTLLANATTTLPAQSSTTVLSETAYSEESITQSLLTTTSPSVSLQPESIKVLQKGNRIAFNGRIMPAAWSQWQVRGSSTNTIYTGLSDASLVQLFGLELLSTNNLTQQPVQWFPQSSDDQWNLTPIQLNAHRYLDITEFAKTQGWQLQVQGNTLIISSPTAQVQTVDQQLQLWSTPQAVVLLPRRLTIQLDRPTPWQADFLQKWTPPASPSVANPATPGQLDPADDESKPQATPSQTLPAPRLDEWLITLDGSIDAKQVTELNQLASQIFLLNRPSTKPEKLNRWPAVIQPIRVETSAQQTTLRAILPAGWRPAISTSGNPHQLMIDIRPDSLSEKQISWASGLTWHQQYVTLGKERFPVVWLEVDLQQPGLSLKPIWVNPETQVGTAPLLVMADRAEATAAINGGFFNRNNTMPLGAIRRDNQWLSSPILNRGVMAWNDRGEVKMGRLKLQETVVTASGERLPVQHLNSAYIQEGISRYTPAWGSAYTPISGAETIVVVENNQIKQIQPAGEVGQTAFAIPRNGYLLVLRKMPMDKLPVGMTLNIESTTVPVEFNQYPHILGAGPLLLQNSQVVLDGKAESFNEAFIKQTASRSAVGVTNQGKLLIVTVHNRPAGAGATLTDLAQIMQQLGAINALNLDGGSSTNLYLGGQILDRPPRTAAPVHNGLGVFLQTN